jgi:hypothetical protein
VVSVRKPRQTEFEVSDGGLCAYSLGNLCFHLVRTQSPMCATRKISDMLRVRISSYVRSTSLSVCCPVKVDQKGGWVKSVSLSSPTTRVVLFILSTYLLLSPCTLSFQTCSGNTSVYLHKVSDLRLSSMRPDPFVMNSIPFLFFRVSRKCPGGCGNPGGDTDDDEYNADCSDWFHALSMM